ncbi:metal-sulfur cluster assembly factor [Pseudonocardia dioxanivorans]|jgi:metal-sulfur cluster biosynthetic enzyme|uniref:metal-sulfur cluster assembly factor n=1 Tax=Pseudonocardia dioxanivorans TaxID=240495 RepID=UPI000CD0F368|nr:iron-sulfur cluster assembly protein [Pseudonocardia dioxanivorans]
MTSPSVQPGPTAQEVHGALRTVADPCSIATGVPIDMVGMGLVKGVVVDAGVVTVELQLTSPFCMQIGLMSEQAEKAIGALPGVSEVRIEVDHAAEWMPEDMEQEARDALRRVRPLPLLSVGRAS